MAEFKLPNNRPMLVKTVRFPEELIEAVEKEIRGTDCTFSAFVVEAVKVAIKSLEEQRERN